MLYAPISQKGIDFVKNVFFCYVDPTIDIDFVVASVAALRDQVPTSKIFTGTQPSIRF
jgi:hypothetical protein